MKRILSADISISVLAALLSVGLIPTAKAGSTMVTDPIGTQELWTFENIVGAQKLTSKINQVDSKGVSQTWDTNGNKLTHTDAEGRVTSYTYNATNQMTSMTEATGTPQARVTAYEYLSPDTALIAKITKPSIYSPNTKDVTTTYDSNRNVIAVTINGFDLTGHAVSRTTIFDHDVYGRVTAIDGPRTDVYDITTLEYYNCSTGAECGQLKKVTNALGHVLTYDSYDNSARITRTTDANGLITAYNYHPRGWLLSRTETPLGGVSRTTAYEYDSTGQLTKTHLPDGSQQNYLYDAAHELREITDNLGNKTEYIYDAKGNRTHELITGADGNLVRSTISAYDTRNFIVSVNSAGSVTQLVNDALGNVSSQTDPNENPATTHSFDALDRLISTVDALTNSADYQYNVADQLTQAKAPNGATTNYEYDDLGNQTREISPDRGTIVYTYDAADNITSATDDRGITRSYQYDALNRLTSVSYPDYSENVTYLYDTADCGVGIGRMCQVNDESGQTNFEYDGWGNITKQTKLELGTTYTTTYEYDESNRVTQMTYPNGRIVNYQRDVIGRVSSVTTTVSGDTTNVIVDRDYRADNLVSGQTLGNGLRENRVYDLQGRVTNISVGALEDWDYSYDANGNITEIDKPAEGRVYGYDALDRIISDTKGSAGTVSDYTYEYDENGNRIKQNSRNYLYASNSNKLVQDANLQITRDAVGNTLNYLGNRSFTYSDSNRLRSVSRAGTLKGIYKYNAFGQRTQKEIPYKRSQIFHFDLQGNIIMRSNHRGKPLEDYIWVNKELKQYTTLRGKRNGSINYEKVKTFITTDHLYTPRLGTNESQVVTWSWDADAFNMKRPNNNPDGDSVKINLNIGFPGQFYDRESSLYYNWNRYYDRKSGRYVTSDPIGLDGGLNTFGYVDGNPLNSYDFKGLRKGPFGPKCGPEGTTGATYLPDISPNACDDHDRCWEECARRCAGKNCKTICDWSFFFKNPVYGLAVSAGGGDVYDNLEKKYGCDSGMCGTVNP